MVRVDHLLAGIRVLQSGSGRLNVEVDAGLVLEFSVHGEGRHLAVGLADGAAKEIDHLLTLGRLSEVLPPVPCLLLLRAELGLSAALGLGLSAALGLGLSAALGLGLSAALGLGLSAVLGLGYVLPNVAESNIREKFAKEAGNELFVWIRQQFSVLWKLIVAKSPPTGPNTVLLVLRAWHFLDPAGGREANESEGSS